MKDLDARVDIENLTRKTVSMDDRLDTLGRRIVEHKTDSDSNLLNFSLRLRAVEEHFIKKCKTCGQAIEENETNR